MINWTFSRRVVLAWCIGIGVMLIGVGKLTTAGGGVVVFVSLGLCLVLMGGFLRPALRGSLLRRTEPAERQKLATGRPGAVWRAFFELDRTGDPHD
jgi:hypothetical protein